MDDFKVFLEAIEDEAHRNRLIEVTNWVSRSYPDFKTKIAWNQPMYTDHGTFIIAFSLSKKHMAVAPEREVIMKFSDEIVKAGYDCTQELMRIKWSMPIDYELLQKMIEFNIRDKSECKTFWRKR